MNCNEILQLGVLKQLDLWRCPSWWPESCVVGNCLLFKVFKNLGNNHRILYASNDLDRALTLLTGFDVDVKYTLETLAH